jgi:CheY-like chemotaxis protein
MKRVLIVDDEPGLTAVVREYLQEQYEVVVANDGTAALAAFQRQRPDVVFLDVNMPGPSGLDVLKQLRQADPTLPVVMVTVDTEMATVQECLRQGAFGYVPKPFDLKYVEHIAALATQTDPGT